MKKIINNPKNYVEEYINGICLAHPNYLKKLNNDFRMIVSSNIKKDKVGIVTAGGSGHLPVFVGYVGNGLIDGCAIGDVFASPSSSKMADLIKVCDSGKGVLCLYGNYGGDKLNFQMAIEEVEFDDIKTKSVIVTDDLASSSDFNKRRGVAGLVYAYKIAGAAADMGYTLLETEKITKDAISNIRTIGIALSPCIVPTVGKPTFSIEENKMEFGMGIHGEAGIEVVDIMEADKVASLIFERINEELDIRSGEEISIMVNGLGSTPLEELYIVYRKLNEICSNLNIKIIMPHVGEFATSMEMTGLSITIFKLNKELKKLLEHPATSPFYTNLNKD